MSSIVVSGDTSGSITLAVPAVAGTNTVTIPAATGTMVYQDSNGTTTLNSNASQPPLIAQINGSEKARISSDGSLLVNQTATSLFKVRVNSVASMETGDGTDGGNYGVVQIVRPATQTGNVFGLSFIRQGNKIAGMGFLQSSDTFAIQNQNNNSGSGVTLTNAATSWGTTSDERKKDIIGNVDNALIKLSDWRSVYFKYKTDNENEQQRIGLIAQDVQSTLPEAISVEQDEIGTLQLRYTETIPLLVAAIKELNAKVDSQAAEIAALKAGD